MDTDITVNCVLAWVAWLIAIAGSIVAFWIQNLGLANLSLLFAGAGITLHIRGMHTALSRREMAAFELGRESVRSIR